MAVRVPRIAVLAVLATVAVLAVAHAATTGGEPQPAAATVATAPPAPAPLPALDEPIPDEPRAIAAALRATANRLEGELDAWHRDRGPAGERPPPAVTRLATYESRIVERLADDRALGLAVLRRVEAAPARRLAPEVRALRDLYALHDRSQRRPGPAPKLRIGPPAPVAELVGHYRDAQERFGVGWHVLAAINYVETRFGRYRNESISGARGPMQFMPATWKAYGMGGDVRDPRDAIMGAANYLRASGAPADNARAIHAYNPSNLYVRTVRMYARRVGAEPRELLRLYAREVVRP